MGYISARSEIVLGSSTGRCHFPIVSADCTQLSTHALRSFRQFQTKRSLLVGLIASISSFSNDVWTKVRDADEI